MTIRRIGSLTAILFCCSFPLQGKEQHLRFDTETEVYELTFDDQVVSYADMQRIAWLSPLIDPTVPHPPFFMTIQRVVPGKIEKHIIASPLETCMPSYTECRNPTLNEAFLRNAAEVLKKTGEQLELLKEESLPGVLEPVRSYLIFTLQSTLYWNKAKYAYLRDSNMEPVREQFCKYCLCSSDPGRIEKMAVEKNPHLRGSSDWKLIPGLLDRMAKENDPAKKLTLATHDFQNVLVHCFAAHDPGYPVQVWKDFLKQYNIRESFKPKAIP
jgi:hypothetical protein